METEGKIIKVLGERSGQSQEGRPWRIAEYVLETDGRFRRHIKFQVSDGMSQRIARLGLQEGKEVHIWFDIDAREYNGQWFNVISAYDARELNGTNSPQQEDDSEKPF